MIRLLIFIAALAAASYGLDWLVQQPGTVALDWGGYHAETSIFVGAAALIAGVAVLVFAWAVFVYVVRLPSRAAKGARQRRREKGYEALSKGIVAAGAGNAAEARRAVRKATKYLGKEPLTHLLKAQVAQLEGNSLAAETIFHEMTLEPETKLLGLRGLHIEAKRRKDAEAAHHFADTAHQIAPLPWAGQALLEHHAAQGDWQAARADVEASLRSKAIDLPAAQRLRAVLETALALEKEEEHPSESLHLARQAAKRAPGFVPAAALGARLLARHGDGAKALKLVEKEWMTTPHPELAEAYLAAAPGESNSERLARVKKLAQLSPSAPESAVILARAALAARDFAVARHALAPLVADGQAATAQVCLLMAELEDAEFGSSGAVKEWLARGSRAPRDPAWVADGVVSKTWAPVSPVTGKLDAFVWERPPEPLRAPAGEGGGAGIPAPALSQTPPEAGVVAKLEAAAS